MLSQVSERKTVRNRALSKQPRTAFSRRLWFNSRSARGASRARSLIKSTKEYLSQGGRLIDTAQMYRNHEDLAVALRESGVPREQIWLTSKIDTHVVTTRHSALAAVKASAAELGVSYVDLMLIHGI